MATARLRKTFHYPANNSNDDETPSDLDEEGLSIPVHLQLQHRASLTHTQSKKISSGSSNKRMSLAMSSTKYPPSHFPALHAQILLPLDSVPS